MALTFLQVAAGISVIGGLSLSVQSNQDIVALMAVMVGLVVYVGAAYAQNKGNK